MRPLTDAQERLLHLAVKTGQGYVGGRGSQATARGLVQRGLATMHRRVNAVGFPALTEWIEPTDQGRAYVRRTQ